MWYVRASTIDYYQPGKTFNSHLKYSHDIEKSTSWLINNQVIGLFSNRTKVSLALGLE